MAGVTKVAMDLLSELLTDITGGHVRVFSSRVSDDGQTEMLEIVYDRQSVNPRNPHRPCPHTSAPLDASDADDGKDGHSFICAECGAAWCE